ncbi:MAG: metal ABC transporter permease [Bacillota bacterium]
MELLNYGFMQRALLAGLFIGIACPLVGTFLILKRLSMIGDALAHVSMAGIAFGLILGINPTLAALAATGFASFIINVLEKNFKKYGELSIAIIMSAGLGIGIILISVGKDETANVMSYLFGSIIAITMEDLLIIIIISLLVLISLTSLYHKLLFMSFDEEAAMLSGIKVKQLNIYFLLLTAMTVAISIKVTGVLLISALMTIPASTSLQVAKSFKTTILFSICFSLASVFAGLFLSYYLNWPPGGTIILVSLFLLLSVLFFKNLSRY